METSARSKQHMQINIRASEIFPTDTRNMNVESSTDTRMGKSSAGLYGLSSITNKHNVRATRRSWTWTFTFTPQTIQSCVELNIQWASHPWRTKPSSYCRQAVKQSTPYPRHIICTSPLSGREARCYRSKESTPGAPSTRLATQVFWQESHGKIYGS